MPVLGETYSAEKSSVSVATGNPSAWQRAVISVLSQLKKGRLELDLPSGERLVFGEDERVSAEPGVGVAKLTVLDGNFFFRCAIYGDIGFGESYVAGEWTSPEPAEVVAFFIRNFDFTPGMSGSRRRFPIFVRLLRTGNLIRHWSRFNSRRQARRNIAAHYDLSNDFFGLFLGSSMMYSAARWKVPGMSLESAQEEKNESLCQKLRLSQTDHVLEIGSGWGGWAVHAAHRYGCRVTSLTISRRQFEFARKRVADAGLSGRVSVELCDYRDIRGQFDKIVSIEMLEAIGHRFLPKFCEVVSRTLRPDGILALQYITCPDARYDEFRKGVDFIQKHIFPGSLLLSANRVNDELSKAGGLGLYNLEDLGADYARTLSEWRIRFSGRLDEVRGQGFDEAFIRKWTYYLSYCEAAFALRNISVIQTVHTRSNSSHT